MNQDVQAALVDFESALQESNTGLASFLSLLWGLLESGAGQVSYALMRHAQDILVERGVEVPPDYPALIADAYRRTFCSEQHAGSYGMEPHAAHSPGVVTLLRSMAHALRHSAASTEEERGQISLALDADTSNRH